MGSAACGDYESIENDESEKNFMGMLDWLVSSTDSNSVCKQVQTALR